MNTLTITELIQSRREAIERYCPGAITTDSGIAVRGDFETLGLDFTPETARAAFYGAHTAVRFLTEIGTLSREHAAEIISVYATLIPAIDLADAS